MRISIMVPSLALMQGACPDENAILRRGLDPDPARRFPSMVALLEVLRRDPSQILRRRLRLATLLVSLSVGVCGLGAASVMWRGRSMTCGGAPERLRGVWDAGRREAVRASLLRANNSDGGALSRLIETLDRYADDDQSLALLASAAERFERLEGPLSFALIHVLGSEAEVLNTQLRFQEAEGLARRACAIAERSIGMEHSVALAASIPLIDALVGEGRAEEAWGLGRRALQILAGLREAAAAQRAPSPPSSCRASGL